MTRTMCQITMLVVAITAPDAVTGQVPEASAMQTHCPGTPRTVTGVIYCDNTFALWVNGQRIAVDPIDFTPHQAVRVSFDWDGVSSLTYAIQCEDFASESGYEYTGTRRPQLGDGALIAEFDDGFRTVTSSDWRLYTVTFGPTDSSIEDGCSATNLTACVVDDRGTPDGWTASTFDDDSWVRATNYASSEAGWGRPPRWSTTDGCCGRTSPVDRSGLGCDAQVTQDQCLDPRTELSGSAAAFIWGADLERDNRVLFRHTARCARTTSAD